MRKILIFVAFLVEILTLHRWLHCWHFTDGFYYTPPLLIDRVIGGINDDYGNLTIITHIMHNKATYLVWGFLQTFLQYWDARFLKEFISIAGCIGVYLGLWYFFTKIRGNKYLRGIFLFAVVFQCIQILFSPDIKFLWIILPLGITYIIFSMYGLWQFLAIKSNARYGFIITLLAFSIGSMLLLPLAYEVFCLKI